MDLKTLEAAATWYVQLNDGACDETRTQAWRQWLQASPHHAAAWARVEKLQQQWAMVPAQAALSSLGAAQAQRRDVLKVLGLLVAMGGGSWLAAEQVPYRALLAQQRTGTGERRTLALADGSQLELNVGTALDVRYDTKVRAIQLYQGEILVRPVSEVQHRPFIVHTEDGSILARSTEFSIRKLAHKTRVGILQASVEVRPQRHVERRLQLQAGQQVSFDQNDFATPHALPVDSTAWRHGMLSVNDWRLGDFLEELGRYRPGVLRCASSIQAMSISGAFRIDDTDIALANLPKTLPVKLRYLSRYWVSVEPA
ncbi:MULTISPECIES: FecR domain-containing protein [unclassified Pseudomonas]|uniref:FecR domain-containing protein n=1 Tax=unclassified Pseudomonas TaxID=196821 RepID=UPI000C889466|nr:MULTISPECIES: FecR domain-containing protein [unclassified Pseudomonas]PNA97903.1 iron dicitrate transport regulator FecR [Pseudomonas sp. GW460-5]PNB60452.1 iron dicitrate transport regulator FecR [Pseudomonas sp. FW305-130]